MSENGKRGEEGNCVKQAMTGNGGIESRANRFASDFRQLYAEQPLHAGLIILIPAVNRMMQQRLFKAALDELAVVGEPVNRVLEVDLDREEVTLTLYELP
jgi:hypothetical protein